MIKPEGHPFFCKLMPYVRCAQLIEMIAHLVLASFLGVSIHSASSSSPAVYMFFSPNSVPSLYISVTSRFAVRMASGFFSSSTAKNSLKPTMPPSCAQQIALGEKFQRLLDALIVIFEIRDSRGLSSNNGALVRDDGVLSRDDGILVSDCGASYCEVFLYTSLATELFKRRTASRKRTGMSAMLEVCVCVYSCVMTGGCL